MHYFYYEALMLFNERHKIQNSKKRETHINLLNDENVFEST